MGLINNTDLPKEEKSGFTIIELLLSIAVIGFIVVSIAGMVNVLSSINSRSRNLSVATVIAEGKIEALRSAGYNSVTVGTVNFTSELPSYLGSTKSAQYVVTQPQTGLRKIVLTITYKDQRSNKTVSYESFIGELGVGQ